MSNHAPDSIMRVILVVSAACGLLIALIYGASLDINLAMLVTTGALLVGLALIHLRDLTSLPIMRQIAGHRRAIQAYCAARSAQALDSLKEAVAHTIELLGDVRSVWKIHMYITVARFIVRHAPTLALMVCLSFPTPPEDQQINSQSGRKSSAN